MMTDNRNYLVDTEDSVIFVTEMVIMQEIAETETEKETEGVIGIDIVVEIEIEAMIEMEKLIVMNMVNILIFQTEKEEAEVEAEKNITTAVLAILDQVLQAEKVTEEEEAIAEIAIEIITEKETMEGKKTTIIPETMIDLEERSLNLVNLYTRL